MLDTTLATGYILQVSEEAGASRPLVLTAQRAAEFLDVHTKITDGSRITIQSLVIEAIASVLAVDLALCTPEPFLVKITPEFIESVHDAQVAQRLHRACPIAFGTRSIPNGYSVVQNNMELDNSNKQMAAEIFAFDALIDNPDRGGLPPAKRNCLLYNNAFYVIDHEKAFQSAVGILLGAKQPWEFGGLEHLNKPDSHLFINQLRKCRKKLDFSSFKNKWQSLPNERFDEYKNALPLEWSSEAGNAQKIITKLAILRDNIEGCLKELQRVLE